MNSSNTSSNVVSASSVSVSVPSVNVVALEHKVEKLTILVSKMSQHYADNLVRHPEQFASGLGKKANKKKQVRSHRTHDEKRQKRKPEKPSKLDAWVTQGPQQNDEFDAFVQGPVEWLTSHLSVARESVEDTLRAPIDEAIGFFQQEEIGSSLRAIAELANRGEFNVNHVLAKETMMLFAILSLIVVTPFITRTQVLLLLSVLSIFVMLTSTDSGSLFSLLVEKFKSFVGFGKDVTQSDLDFGSCYRFAVSCFAYWNMKLRYGDEATSFDKVHALGKSIKIAASKAADMTSALESVQDLIRDTLEFVNKLFGLEIDTSLFKGETWFEIEKLNAEYVELKSMYDVRDSIHTVANRLVTLEAHGMTLLNRFRTSGPAYMQYRDAMFRITALREELGKLGAFGNSTRQEPLFVLVCGQAGIGKSTVSKILQATMIKEACGPLAVKRFSENDSGSYVYAPNQESKYLDGYNNQPLVLLDDFASSVEACKIWTQNIIHLVNTQPHQTSQASLERKGTVYFDSKFILATSNVASFANVLQHMYSKEAVCRRIHAAIKAKVKPEFALASHLSEPMADPEKISQYRAANPSALECFWLDFVLVDPLHGTEMHMCECGDKCEKPDGKCSPAAFKDVLKYIVRLYRFRRDYEEAQKARNKSMMEFLTTDVDTLEALEKAFTQGTCGHSHCYACERDPGMRAALALWWFDQRLKADREYPHQSDTLHPDDEKVLTDLKDFIVDKSLLKEVFTDKSAFKPMCVKEFAYRRKIDLKSAYMDPRLSRDYAAMIGIWGIAQQNSWSLSASLAFQDIKHSIVQHARFYLTFKKLAEYSRMILPVVGAALSLKAAYDVFTARRRAAALKAIKKREKKDGVVVQSVDSQHDQVVRSLLGSNILYMQDGDTFCGYALGIGGSLVVMNKHVFHNIKNSHPELSFLKKTTKKNRFSYTVSVDTLQVYESPTDDLVCVSVPKFNCQNVTHHFADEDILRTDSFNAQLTCWSPENDGYVVETSSGLARLGAPISAVDPDGKEFRSHNTIVYDIPTENGQCGALITRIDASRRAKVVGLHAAGNATGSRGYGILLKKHFIEKCFAHFETPVIQYAATSDIQQHFEFVSAPKVEVEDLQCVGKATPIAAVYKSEICKSPLYGEIADPPKKKPAMLNPFHKDGKLFDPVANALKEYSRGGRLCNREVFRASTSAYIHELTLETVRPMGGVLTFEETVMGSKDKAPWLKPINRSTSSGSPSRFNPSVGSKKREAFGYDENYTFDTPGARHIKEQFDQAHEALKKGPIPMVFAAFPKDELRPTEKVHAGKTRVVFSCDVVNTLLIRKYFGTFASWYQDPNNRFKNSSAVGMNVADQFECRAYAEHLGNGHPNADVKAGDHTGFDKNLPSEAIDSVWDVYEEFMRPKLTAEELLIAKHVFISFTKPFIQFKDCIIEWDNSNPSGNPITTILNTICNNIILRYGVARSLGATTFKDAKKLLVDIYHRKAVTYMCYGDDNVWKVDTVLIKKYGVANITYAMMDAAMSEMGMKYTDELKSDTFDEARRTVFDISFLKRTLACENGVYYMRLALDTLTQNVQWAKKKDIDGELFRVKVEGFLDELAIHDQATWDFWYAEFYSAAKRVDPRYNLRVQWGRSRTERAEDFLARGCEYW